MNAGILLFNNVEELDFAGPWEILSKWSEHAEGPAQRLIVAQSTAPISCAQGLIVVPHLSYVECPPLDLLIVPGGQGTRSEVENESTIAFIREQAEHCKAVLSVCTGAFLLYRAGLLSNKRATTHWNSLDRLKAFTDVAVVEERFVNDGKIWTSAGVSAGIDMALAFIADFAGEEAATKVQAAAEYYPLGKRYGKFHMHPKAPQYLK